MYFELCFLDRLARFTRLIQIVLLVAEALCMLVAVDHCVADRFSFLPEPRGGSNSKGRLQTTTKANRKANTEA